MRDVELCSCLVVLVRDRNLNGAVAQLGEHLLCKQGVSGSIPLSSTKVLVLRTERSRERRKPLSLKK
jgi:hypothetical protein